MTKPPGTLVGPNTRGVFGLCWTLPALFPQSGSTKFYPVLVWHASNVRAVSLDDSVKTREQLEKKKAPKLFLEIGCQEE